METPDTSQLVNMLKEEPFSARTQELYKQILQEVQETYVLATNKGLVDKAIGNSFLEMDESQKQEIFQAVETKLLNYLQHLKNYRRNL